MFFYYILGLLVVVGVIIPGTVILINWSDAKRQCDTYVSFKTFQTLYERWPNKWFLNNSYVEFDAYTPSSKTQFSNGLLKLYFQSPMDQLKYYFYADKIYKQKELERQTKNYDTFVQAFRGLEE